MTLREFAETIGIPVETVSKALNTQTKYRISPEKVAFIRAQAEELGFHREPTSEFPQKIRRIGLLCGPMLTYLGGFLYEGVRKVCNDAGVRVILVGCDNSPDNEKNAFRQICSEDIDTLIY